MPLHPASTRTTDRPGHAYARLRSLIVSGRIAPGTRLIETEIARGLDVSRTPVREAVQRLAHEGLVHAVGSGSKAQFAASPVTVHDLAELFAIIGALEGVAGRGVAGLGLSARRKLATELTARNTSFARESRRRRRDFRRFFAAHDDFHRLFVERCGSPRVRQLVETIRPQVKRYELIYAGAVGRDFTESLREHRDIVAALRTGDPDGAERAIRLNWSNSAGRLVRALAATPLVSIGDYRSASIWPAAAEPLA